MEQQDARILGYVQELVSRHGADALEEAERRMYAEMDKGDVKEAGVWLAVMYEIAEASTEKSPS